MNLNKFFIFLLIGIICSVSVVSATDINDTAVEIQSNDTTISVDGLQNDITIQKFEDNASDDAKNPVQSDNSNSTDENALGQNNTTSNDEKINDCRDKICSSALNTGLHFNLQDNTANYAQKGPVVAVAGFWGWITNEMDRISTFYKIIDRWGLNSFIPSWDPPGPVDEDLEYYYDPDTDSYYWA